MSNSSGIEWTEATWNPTTGCTKISPGCKNCYAETLTKRLLAMKVKKYRNGFQYKEHHRELDLPFTWKKPKKIFVNSMSDLFHEEASMEFIGACFNTMIQADWHQYQVLSKRPSKMIEFSKLFVDYFGHKIPKHIWMGVSVENEDYKWRIKELKKVKCSTRFLSLEPLIGPIGKINLEGIDWVIIGGESGFGFRPVDKKWIKDIILQCKKQKTAVFFKQWGGIRPKAGGRTINNRIYDDYPTIIPRKNLCKEITYDHESFKNLANYDLKKPIKIHNDSKYLAVKLISPQINIKRNRSNKLNKKYIENMSVWRKNKQGKAYKRKVQRVVDGDTFKVRNRVSGSQFIRIAGINCPEKGQRGYTSAKTRLSKLKGKTVTVRPVGKSYGRTVANVTFRHKKLRIC